MDLIFIAAVVVVALFQERSPGRDDQVEDLVSMET